jgi:DNA-binding XRE family transcriptional regulator
MMEFRPDDKFEIGKRFRGLRRRSHFTQSRLGEIIKVSRSTISKVENAHVTPHRKTWEAFFDLEEKHRRAQEVRLPARWL